MEEARVAYNHRTLHLETCTWAIEPRRFVGSCQAHPPNCRCKDPWSNTKPATGSFLAIVRSFHGRAHPRRGPGGSHDASHSSAHGSFLALSILRYCIRLLHGVRPWCSSQARFAEGVHGIPRHERAPRHRGSQDIHRESSTTTVTHLIASKASSQRPVRTVVDGHPANLNTHATCKPSVEGTLWRACPCHERERRTRRMRDRCRPPRIPRRLEDRIARDGDRKTRCVRGSGPRLVHLGRDTTAPPWFRSSLRPTSNRPSEALFVSMLASPSARSFRGSTPSSCICPVSMGWGLPPCRCVYHSALGEARWACLQGRGSACPSWVPWLHHVVSLDGETEFISTWRWRRRWRRFWRR